MADHIAHLKKGNMARQAETLLADSGWLPEPLRTPGLGAADAFDSGAMPAISAAGAQSTADGGETAIGDETPSEENDPADAVPHPVAAE